MTLFATTTATNIVLAVLAFNLLIAGFLYVVELRRQRFDRRQTLHVPLDWQEATPETDDDLAQETWR